MKFDAPGGRDLAECSCRAAREARELVARAEWADLHRGVGGSCPWCASSWVRPDEDRMVHRADCEAALFMGWERRP